MKVPVTGRKGTMTGGEEGQKGGKGGREGKEANTALQRGWEEEGG
jgi:hypothetical protein